ncbi:uncharacterized protein KGF55_002025 [Candida pseudojiufengensis]|uniref:uncharacterized protein n=1 Tax=Candida pseudojiufengensis TaxID=497109 RepID=UPI002224297B|nr:uncharacterized protein KGF55_002025 [Candida pseudojiufengensis]KAI5964083.1 hypothetical protein KGF55_002025 [Candida pseudojiufengensis]
MDPFNGVKEDAYDVIQRLETIISQRTSTQPSIELQQDFTNYYEELQETYEELEEALKLSSTNPQFYNLSPKDIKQREQTLRDLYNRKTNIKSKWDNKKFRDVTTMSNRISQDDIPENPFRDQTEEDDVTPTMTNYQQQELIREQDTQLDDIHKTMMNLNKQANMMGEELEDQGYLLDELDYELDHVDIKLQRNMKRLNIFIEKNKETASNWCIGILVVALCVLLVLLIVV